MSRRTTLWDHLRWDLLVLAVLAAIIGGYVALQQPSIQPAESPMGNGSKPPDRSEGDVLLLVPTAPAAEAREFENMDCSFGWFNALWQHFGTFATTPYDRVSPELLAGHAAVVVPSRVASELSTTVREDLEAFVRHGGQLLVEMPRQEWAHMTGVSTAGSIDRAASITAVEGLETYGPVREHLIDVPLSGRLLPATDLQPRPSGPVVFDVEEQPGMVAEPLDEGMVFSLLFDFSCSLAAMHQGRPTQQMQFGDPEESEWIATQERVASDEMTTAFVPYATILQRAVFNRLPESRPMARLWPFPDHYSGAAMTQHPALESPRPSFAYADRAHRQESASTIIAAADSFSGDHAGLARSVDADIGLLWVLGEDRPPLVDGVGIGAIQPWARELTIADQKERLEHNIGDPDSMRIVQSESSRWAPDWDTAFRQLAAAGLDIDTSFGPTDADHYGYLFGNSMPFHPLDRRGRPLPLLEAPFVLDGANLTSQRLRRLFADSQQDFHQPLSVNVGADAMEKTPSVGLLEGVRDIHRLADDHNHWLTTVGDYVDFLSARRQSVVTSQWSRDDGRLTISVNLLGAQVDTASDGAVPSVAVPARFDGRDLARVEIDDDDIDIASPPTTGPGDERLISLPPGRHVISVFYESP